MSSVIPIDSLSQGQNNYSIRRWNSVRDQFDVDILGVFPTSAITINLGISFFSPKRSLHVPFFGCGLNGGNLDMYMEHLDPFLYYFFVVGQFIWYIMHFMIQAVERYNVIYYNVNILLINWVFLIVFPTVSLLPIIIFFIYMLL